MSNEFKYKGYSGSCIASIDDDCLHGRILFIDDLITYEGNRVSELGVSFKEAVDGYINYCKESGKPANKPYSGSFNVRPGPELHKSATQCAVASGVKLNEFVRGAIQNAVNLHHAQHEIKSKEIELESYNPKKTQHWLLTPALNSMISPYKQAEEVATSTGSASLIENPFIPSPNIYSGTSTEGIKHAQVH